jgi:predicted nucleic acid-binding protein
MMVWFELVDGALNCREQRRALQLLNRFERVDLVTEDYQCALDQMIAYRLSHSTDAFDCLIAAPSHRLQLPLYTMNLRHFTPLLGAPTQKPC